ncbi:cholecystokinin receptor type A-like [Saccostrea cucullata]|uniref:cholecystokinin receptor type A-like n=1 Tax=Saccostrea cuccullata TaxID=36930 RepID=UPI002ED20089
MLNKTNALVILQESYLELSLPNTVLIIMAAVIGVTGNCSIIVIYFYRIKERGERYFIPLLALVDLVGSLTIAPFYVIGNLYFYVYPNDNVCRILSFFQFLVTGISAHVLLLISIQRYLLVCRPFGPRMTHFWKRVSFALVCIFSLAYSVPVLKTSGVKIMDDIYMNQTISTRVCKFSVANSTGVVAYFGLLVLISVLNIVMTAGFYSPVLRQLRLSKNIIFSTCTPLDKKRCNQYYSFSGSSVSNSAGEETDHYVNEPSHPTTEHHSEKSIPTGTETKNVSISQDNSSQTKSEETRAEIPNNVTTMDIRFRPQNVRLQRRISIMFLVVIVTYILSYIPPLILLLLTYTIKDFNYITLTKGETLTWIYLPRLLFINHVVNPFIYGYFDAKYREQLRNCFRRQ